MVDFCCLSLFSFYRLRSSHSFTHAPLFSTLSAVATQLSVKLIGLAWPGLLCSGLACIFCAALGLTALSNLLTAMLACLRMTASSPDPCILSSYYLVSCSDRYISLTFGILQFSLSNETGTSLLNQILVNILIPSHRSILLPESEVRLALLIRFSYKATRLRCRVALSLFVSSRLGVLLFPLSFLSLFHFLPTSAPLAATLVPTQEQISRSPMPIDCSGSAGTRP